MKIIAFDRFKPGVTLATVQPYLRDEVSNVWRLWKAGIVRENYARADEPGSCSNARRSKPRGTTWLIFLCPRPGFWNGVSLLSRRRCRWNVFMMKASTSPSHSTGHILKKIEIAQ
jgi:hypothetical protein